MGMPVATIDVHCPSNPELVCPYRAGWAEMYAHPETRADDPIQVGTAFEHDDKVLALKGAEHELAALAIGCDRIADEPECPIAVQMSQSKVRITLRDIFRTIVGSPRT